ncbi:MAG TPA: response regulator [Verrucomicrobiae bacterium]|jgi:CheY-like chemotaxis protein|nr:response regulator [Verrucomicrobiae bacterium]
MMETLFKLRVLMIEDSPSHVQMIQHMMERLGYENNLVNFDTGTKALAYLEESLAVGNPLPNLIIVDLRLADGENGLHVLKKIRANACLKDIPIILNSSYADAEDVRAAYEEESTFFIPKNYDTKALAEAIETLKMWGRLK